MSNLEKSKSDEVPCRSCTSFTEYMKQSKKRFLSDMAKTTSGTDSNNNRTFEGPVRKDCPADREILGTSTWIFLHTMAAKYPEKPCSADKKDMAAFFNIFAKFYPCDFCAQDFQQEIKKNPPKVDSQNDLSQWLCRMHNAVNVKIGKSEFDCSKVNERWRDGWLDGSCG